MSLSLYKKKRRFDVTPEPEGKNRSSKKGLRFVVQKHDASHVHYDFRLEMDGVLKSWAVPKGPSLNPDDKRLAMMVEDHPYDYRNFEGVIPAGNYGGGTVIVWDEGTYEALEGQGLSNKEQEKLLQRQLHEGNLKIILHGKKLKGEFALFLMKSRGERSWILMKKKDEFASKKDITKEDHSVKSGKSLVQVAADNGTTVNHPENGTSKTRRAKPIQLLDPVPAKAAKKSAGRKAAAGVQRKKKVQPLKDLPAELSRSVRTSAMPHDITPMLATLTDEPFDNNEWIYEIKWDGYRAVAYSKEGKVELQSRNLSPFTEKYFPVTEAIESIGINAVLDGEIVAVDEKGLAAFQSLQNWQNTPGHLQYYVFDILWLDGKDLTRLPLAERKKILKEVLPEDDEVIRYSDHVAGKGTEFFEAALQQGLEGIMAKKASSTYKVGLRTDDWVKIKVNQRQEVVIAGYTEPRNTRKFFGSLLLGLYEDGDLVYIGHTGSGFNAKSLAEIHKKLQPLVTEACPFKKCPKGNMPVTWVKPQLVCEIKFTEWTKNRMARHPIFMGLRTDKKAKDVHFEKAVTMNSIKKNKTAPGNPVKRSVSKKQDPAKKKVKRKRETVRKLAAPKKTAVKNKTAAKKKAPSKKTASTKVAVPASTATGKKDKASLIKAKVPDLSVDGDQELKLDGHTLKLTNLGKLYWKKEGFSKGEMIRYYLEIAPYMLPYMMDRPQSLNRHPNGIDGPNFFQKDVEGKVPGWIQKHEDFSESTNKTVSYMVCTNTATLIYMANLGCIEMHPWHSRTSSWENPDWCLIDLDPDKKNSFDQVMEVAKVVKQVLDSIGADAYCKTSGSSGIHIYIPLGAKYDYNQSKQLAELVVNLVHSEMPSITSVERSPSKRKGLIYLDFLQNRQTQTAAAPYSLRPKPGIPVSTPIDWTELKKGLTPTTYNARNIFARLKTEGDLFKPVLGKGIDLEKVLGKLASLIR